MSRTIILVALASLTSAAIATPINEIEPNDSFAGAQVLPAGFFDPYGAGAVEAVLGMGDVDFFKVALPDATLVTASVFDFTPADPNDNDSFLGVFRPDGTLFATDDDSGPGFLSSLAFVSDEAGMWGFAVTGFGDTTFIGEHEENFAYRLVLSIPEPASALALALGSLLLRRR